MELSGCRVLYIEPVESEHIEEYLEAVWLLEEMGESPVKISTISQNLGVAPPSAVQMLRKLEKSGYLKYLAREGVTLTRKGRVIGERMVRNGRLIEKMMADSLGIEVDPKVACGIEHHMSQEFADALCTLMKHPRKCPHGQPIPKGKCCPKDK
ncbi:MAG: metal-dependent transcriptional regulator [Thaumarchaeota archaeon]|nr:metal-dependent transcriptional regulator [Nitrososphaerota archaeon]MCL5318955.1 metal-dependent transcriptional regulator [Nitrososphaerota archaeon]